MNDSLISANDIYVQDVVCSVVMRNTSADDFTIYNQVAQEVEIQSIDTAAKILQLIRLTKYAIMT